MIAIGCDHGGFELKNLIKEHLDEKNIKFKDFGTYTNNPCDFPDYVKQVTNAIIKGECDSGILICGTGVGMSIAANRVKGIRAALCSDVYTAEATRQDNNANVLALGARVVGPGLALKIIDTFFNSSFTNDERHIRRLNKID